MDEDGLGVVKVRRKYGQMFAIRRRYLPLTCVTRRVVIWCSGFGQYLLFRGNSRLLGIRLRAAIARGCAGHAIQSTGNYASDDQRPRSRNAGSSKDGRAPIF